MYLKEVLYREIYEYCVFLCLIYIVFSYLAKNSCLGIFSYVSDLTIPFSFHIAKFYRMNFYYAFFWLFYS